MTPPGNNAVMNLGARIPRATAVEGADVCLERAKDLVDELTAEVSD
jgi:hypothetical protein